MTNNGDSSTLSTRLTNTTTCLPISYGSIAFYLGKQQLPSNPSATHRWTLYVRSPDPTYDLSHSISKVVFQLHPSFPQATRELTQAPFEVTEYGWGEFEASIRIIWKNEGQERPVLLNHFIKLYPNNAPVNYAVDPSTYMSTDVPVVSERYDEVVFTDPMVAFHKLLVEGGGGNNGKNKKKRKQLGYPLSNEVSVIEHFRTYGDEGDVKAMLAAKEFLEKELRNVKDRLIKADEELEEVKGQLAAAASASAAVATAATVTKTASSGATGGTKGNTTSSATSGKGGSTSTKSKKKKASSGGSGEPAAKKTKS